MTAPLMLPMPGEDASDWAPARSQQPWSRRDRAGVHQVTVWSPREGRHVFARVSVRLASVVDQSSWRLDRAGYPCATIGGRKVYLHRLAYGPVPEGRVLDHIDRNVLNAADDNLRALTPMESSVNRGRPKRSHPPSSKFRGVTAFRLAAGRIVWQAGMIRAGKFHHFGLHRMQAQAAIAYNRGARRLWPTLYLRNHIPVRRTATTVWATSLSQHEAPVTRTLTFAFERSTKRTHRFQELDEAGQPAEQSSAVVGTLYIKQGAFENGEPPTTIVVTLAA